MTGKLIVIEGTDSSGKKTQTERLYQRLSNEGHSIMKVDFPNYSKDSSALVKMYLRGDFGDKPHDVNAYVASTFFAVDRFASFKTEWQDFYNDGGIIISDRYTTSNMVHQASKFNDLEEKEAYLNWLWDLEFVKFGLPKPELVIFLDMPPNISAELMKNRCNKITGESKKDIHENDLKYLTESYQNACKIADKYNWKKVSCAKNDYTIKGIDEIHNEIYSIIKNHL